MGSGGGSQRFGVEGFGVVGREAAAVVDAVAVVVERLDPELVGGRDAMDLVEVFSRLEHLASAGVALAARRVAQTDLWRRRGHRSAAHWLAQVTGMDVAAAVRLLEAAETVEKAPDTREALRRGEVSVPQAQTIGSAEAVDPDAGRRLLDDVSKRTLRETQADARRVLDAASAESPDEKAERHRRNRRVWHGVDADGMGVGGWRLPMAEHTRFLAQLEGEQGQVFQDARQTGVREPAQAYAADALMRILDRAASKAESSGEGSEDWSFTKVIVRVDLTALDRGHVQPGEVCEVAGRGPIPVGDVWRMIDGDAFIAAVTTRGAEISQVVHLGRRPTVLQRTALEHMTAGTCSIRGCDSTARLEIDHVTDWATSRRTELRQLAAVCGHHHDLKTHHGYRFGPLHPDGKRALIPPSDTGPPGQPDTGPPDLTLHPGAAPPPDPTTGTTAEQRGLFDTG